MERWPRSSRTVETAPARRGLPTCSDRARRAGRRLLSRVVKVQSSRDGASCLRCTGPAPSSRSPRILCSRLAASRRIARPGTLRAPRTRGSCVLASENTDPTCTLACWRTTVQIQGTATGLGVFCLPVIVVRPNEGTQYHATVAFCKGESTARYATGIRCRAIALAASGPCDGAANASICARRRSSCSSRARSYGSSRVEGSFLTGCASPSRSAAHEKSSPLTPKHALHLPL